METLISALGIIISTLLDLPSHAAAASDAKKVKIARQLGDLILLLDRVISRGQGILGYLERLPASRERLKPLLDAQVRDLRDIDQLLERGLGLENREWEAIRKQQSDVGKVLSIYEPNLGKTLNSVVGFKRYTLSHLQIFATSSLESDDGATIKEITFADLEFIQRAGGMNLLVEGKDEDERIEFFHYCEEQGKLRLHTVDLSDEKARCRYVAGAHSRLRELSLGRDKLAFMVQAHYEPHHLI